MPVAPAAAEDGAAWWFDGVGGGGPGSALPPAVVLEVAVAASEDEAAMETAGAARSQRRSGVLLVGNVYRGCWAAFAVSPARRAAFIRLVLVWLCGPTCWPSGGPLLRIAATWTGEAGKWAGARSKARPFATRQQLPPNQNSAANYSKKKQNPAALLHSPIVVFFQKSGGSLLAPTLNVGLTQALTLLRDLSRHA